MLKKSYLQIVGLFSFCVSMAGCPTPTTPGGLDTYDVVKQRGKLVVLLGAAYPPFNSVDKSGEVMGLDVDIAQEIAKDMQVELDIQILPWEGMLAFFATGKGDLIIDGISITEERKKAIDFSDPYYSVGQVILKRKENARIQSYHDLDHPDFRIACQMGATSEKATKKFMPKAKIINFPTQDEGASALSQNLVDAVVMDDPWVKLYLKVKGSESALEGILEPFTVEPIGIPVRKDSPKMLQQVNDTLKRLKDSGEYQRLLEKHSLAE